MTADLTPILPAAGFPAHARLDLVAAILAGIGKRTARTYQADFRDFARFLGAADPASALNRLVLMPQGMANAAALAYRVHLTERKLAPGTIARRLTALRMAVRVARQLGMVGWSLDVAGPRAESYRDTTGPGRDGWKAMLATAKAEAASGEAKAIRDLALLRLLHDLALRRSEAVGLDLADVATGEGGGAVAVVGKGKTAASKLTLTRQARAALEGWIAVRGLAPGPLFTRLDRAADGQDLGRLTGEAVRLIVAGLARRAGVAKVVRPHGLRHQAITEALDATGGNVRDVQKFSRHARLDTLMIYDDRRADVAGKVAQMVADEE